MSNQSVDADIVDHLNDVFARLSRVEQTVTDPEVMTGASGNEFPSGITVGGVPVTGAPPAPPTAIAVSPSTHFDDVVADVSWTAAAGTTAVRYQVEVAWKNGAVFQVAQQIETGGTQVRVTRLRPNSTYGVRVYPINAINVVGSPFPATGFQEFVTTEDVTTPSLPTGLIVTAGLRSIVVRWTGVADLDVVDGHGQYQVQLSTNSGFTAVIRDSRVGGTIAAFTDLTTGTQYWARVRAIDATGNEGAWTSGASAVTAQVTGPELAVKVASTNRVLNPSFEKMGGPGGGAGKVTGFDYWDGYNWFPGTADGAVTYSIGLGASEGIKACRLQWTTNTGYKGLRQSVPVRSAAGDLFPTWPANTTWIISATVKHNVSTMGKPVLNADAGGFTNVALDSPTPVQGQWQRYSWRRTVGATDVASGFYLAFLHANGDVEVDEVMVAEGDVPATFNTIVAGSIFSDHIVTAGLDAAVVKFGTMSGDRITANTMSVNSLKSSTLTSKDIILGAGGQLKTAGLAPGILLNSQGLSLYNGSSVRTVFLDAASGSATFTGTISGSTITGSLITGGTISGATFRTSASGERIEITSIQENIDGYVANYVKFYSPRNNGADPYRPGRIFGDMDALNNGLLYLRPPYADAGSGQAVLGLESGGAGAPWTFAALGGQNAGQPILYMRGDTDPNSVDIYDAGQFTVWGRVYASDVINAPEYQGNAAGTAGQLRCHTANKFSAWWSDGRIHFYIDNTYITSVP